MIATLAAVLLSLISPGQGASQEQLTLVVPGAPFALAFPKAGFEMMEPAEFSPDGARGYFVAADRATGFAVSFFVEPADSCHSSRECRDMVQKSGFAHIGKVEMIKASQIGEVSVVECFQPEAAGEPIRRQHLFAEFVVQGYWIDLHVSKALYEPADRARVETLVKSVSFVPKPKVQ